MLLFAFTHNRAHTAAALAQRAQNLPADKSGGACQQNQWSGSGHQASISTREMTSSRIA
jgi:hypothetical protein